MTSINEREISKKVDELLNKMTLEEKVGQMLYVNFSMSDNTETVRKYYAGSVANVREVKKMNELQRIALEETRLGIPLINGNDVLHGFKTIFPIPLAEACSWDEKLCENTAAIAAREAIAGGTHWIYAPMVDVTREPRWGRIAEGAGEDPYLGSVLAKARVKGFQRNDWDDKARIAACAKHYIAYGATESGRDYNSVDMSENTLREFYLPPFKAAIEAGVQSIMASFNDFNGIPVTANRFLLTELLRGELGFDDLITSDYEAIGNLIDHGLAATLKDAAEKSILAGVDIDMASGAYLEHLSELVREGKVPEELVDAAVRRILKVKYHCGIIEHPYIDEERESHFIFDKGYLKTALDAARKSIVLLKNEGNILPLRKSIKSIAIIGPMAHSKDMLGTWSCFGNPENSVTLLEGVQSKVTPGVQILYAKGCDIEGNSTEGFEEAVNAAKNADAVIMAVGESSMMSGEANCRTNLDLPGVQEELVKAVYKTGIPVIVVLFNGRPLSIGWIAENIPSVIEAWFLGMQAGNAISDVIFGDFNPGGKLTVSFPRTVGQVPVYYNHKNTGRPDIMLATSSKYLDSPNTPLYPFGYGISYTTFEYKNLRLDKISISQSESIKVWAEISNTGKVTGEEIVQLYIRDVAASITRPIKELKGFQKICLKPGESREVEFELTEKHLGFYKNGPEFVVEPGVFKVWVGPNSEEGLEGEFRVINVTNS